MGTLASCFGGAMIVFCQGNMSLCTNALKINTVILICAKIVEDRFKLWIGANLCDSVAHMHVFGRDEFQMCLQRGFGSVLDVSHAAMVKDV